VERPKIPTITRSFPFSVLTSSMFPVNESNGPSMIRTISPAEKLCRGLSTLSALISPAFWSIPLASSCVMGAGFWFLLDPTKPVTPGTLRQISFQPWSGRSISTMM
jgi:hypothetical protein